MNAFIRPSLRHSHSTKLHGLPAPVRELEEVLAEAARQPTPPGSRFSETINRLAAQFHGYASFFHDGLDSDVVARISREVSPLISFVVFASGAPEQTLRCLDSLNRDGVPDSDTVVAVEPALLQATRELLAQRSQIRVVSSQTVTGRAAAWNRGVEATQAVWMVILNSDVVVSPGFREGLARCVRENDWQIISPAMIEGDLDYDFPAFADTFTRKMNSVSRPGVAWGCTFMVHLRVFKNAGLFRTKSGVAGQEAEDFFTRALRAGFNLGVTGKACVHHVELNKRRLPGMKTRAGDMNYARKKHQLSWRRLVLYRERLAQTLRGGRWRRNELRQFGMTLKMRRKGGKWHYQ